MRQCNTRVCGLYVSFFTGAPLLLQCHHCSDLFTLVHLCCFNVITVLIMAGAQGVVILAVWLGAGGCASPHPSLFQF